MLLTPPDVISQTLLAIPIWILYEIGIIFAGIISRRTNSKSKEIIIDDLSKKDKGSKD